MIKIHKPAPTTCSFQDLKRGEYAVCVKNSFNRDWENKVIIKISETSIGYAADIRHDLDGGICQKYDVRFIPVPANSIIEINNGKCAVFPPVDKQENLVTAYDMPSGCYGIIVDKVTSGGWRDEVVLKKEHELIAISAQATHRRINLMEEVGNGGMIIELLPPGTKIEIIVEK